MMFHHLPLKAYLSWRRALIIYFLYFMRYYFLVLIVYPACYNRWLQSQGTKKSFWMLLMYCKSYFKELWSLFFRVLRNMLVVSSTPIFSAIFFKTERSFNLPSKNSRLFSLTKHLEQQGSLFFSGILSGSGSILTFCSLSPSSYILFFLFFTPFGLPLVLFPWSSWSSFFSKDSFYFNGCLLNFFAI